MAKKIIEWIKCLECFGTGIKWNGYNSVSYCFYCKGKGWVKRD